jgi:hypothetical protein
MTRDNQVDYEQLKQAVELLADSFCQLAERASDIAYARRELYEAYLLEGFTPEQALELCKIL